MASATTIVDELYPQVEKALSKPANSSTLKRAIGKYLDRNSNKLTAIGPSSMIPFLDTDKKALYDAVELEPAAIKDALKKSKFIWNGGQIMKNEFYTAGALAIRFYAKKNNKEMLNAMISYYTMAFYPAIQYKYFKFEPNEQVMNYTINNLSNKFKVKQAGTIFGALRSTTQGSYDLYKPGIIAGTDKGLFDFIMGVRTRLNSLIKHIAMEYYKNRDQNLYLNSDSNSYDEDNYHEADSNIYMVERISNNVALKLVVNGPEMKVIRTAAGTCHVSVNELRNYVTTMISSKHRDEIKEVIESLLFLYLFDNQNKVEDVSRNQKFLLYCLETYKKSNTTNPNIIKIKKILDDWLNELGTYKKTQRLATINNFRRAIYMFFVISIQVLS